MSSEYIVNNVYYHYKLADPQKYFLGRRKIFRFNDLSKVTGIIDVIEFDDRVISLFKNGFYSFYSINMTTGMIGLK